MKNATAERIFIEEDSEYKCGVAITLELIGGKWKGVILWHLTHKTLRFSQLKRRLPGVTQKMLTQQLRELERDGNGGDDPEGEGILVDHARGHEALVQPEL